MNEIMRSVLIHIASMYFYANKRRDIISNFMSCLLIS